MNFRWKSFRKNINILQDRGDSLLQAILDDDSNELLNLISILRKGRIIYLPNISAKLPEFLSSNPSLLSISCFFASTNCFRSLLSHPSNSNAFVRDNQGRTAFHFAAAGGSLEIFQELDQHFDNEKSRKGAFSSNSGTKFKSNVYNYSDIRGKTPIHYAAQFGRLDIIKYLYRKGANLDLPQYKNGRRPIHWASLYGHVDVVRFLVENGVSLTDENSMQPIHFACIGGDVATIEYLISQKVDLNVTYRSYTPLLYAAKFGSLNAIKILLKHKVTLKNGGRKNSPTHEAAMNGHLDVVRFFIQQGCDPNLYDSIGKSILYSSLQHEHYDIVKYLLSLGATVFPDGRYAKKTKNQSRTKLRKSKSKSHSKRAFQDPISLASTRNEDMLLLLLNHIDINEYLNDHSERKKRILISFIKYQSEKLLDILIEQKVFETDWTDLYCQAIDAKSDKAAIIMLDKKLPFNSTSQLITSLIKFKNQSLVNKFLDSGLQLKRKEDDPSLATNFISSFIEYPSIDLLDILIEHEIIEGDCTDIYFQLLGKQSFPVVESMLDKGLQFRSTTELIFTIIKCDSSPLFQKFINSGLKFNIEDDPLLARNLMPYFLLYPSIELLDILVEHEILEGDCTDIYLQLLSKRSFEVVESMLDKRLQFQATTELISKVMKCNNSSLLNKFVNSGLPLSPYSNQKMAINAIYSYNVSLIRTLLESKVLLPDEMPISEKIEISSLDFNSIKTVNFINVVLNAAIMFSPKHMPNYQWGFCSSTSTPYQSVSTNRTNLIEICKLFLNHGFTFSSNDHPICLTTNLTSEQAELLLELLNLIDKSCPNSLDFSKYTIGHIEGLIYNFHNKLARQLLDFFFLHNFSFKPSEENPKFDDLHLILTILLEAIPNSESNSWMTWNYDSSGPYDPTDDQSDYEREKRFMNNVSYINNSFNSNSSQCNDPDLKLIYYLFDHDYIFSSRSLNAIVKYGLKSNNHELIHRAFQHCDLSNEPIITKFGPIYCKTALEIACKNGLVDIAKELIERGANVNEGGYNNHTSPLYYALIANNEELIELLKSKGAISTIEQKQSLQPHFYQYRLQNDFHAKYGRKTHQTYLI